MWCSARDIDEAVRKETGCRREENTELWETLGAVRRELDSIMRLLGVKRVVSNPGSHLYEETKLVMGDKEDVVHVC